MRPDFPRNPEIEIRTGPPFVRCGKQYFRINALYFAERFIHYPLIKIYDDGWFRWGGEWTKINETDVLNDLEDLIIQVRMEYDQEGIPFSESDLRTVLQIIKRKAYCGPMPKMDPDIIPVANGVLRWCPAQQDFEFIEYSPDIMVFNRMPISYDPAATAPQFEAVLQEIIPDAEDRRVAQEYLGAALFFENRTRKFLLCLGEGGCGKTILSLFLIGIIGKERAQELNTSNVNNPYEFSGLTTQSLLTAPEAVSRALCSDGAEWVKKLVGGDFFQTRQKFRNDRVDHYGTFTLIVISNHQLRFRYEGRGDEWRDRVIPIFFDRHIPDERRELGLVDRLIQEEGPGIFNWFLEGAKRVRRNNWKITLSAVQRARIDRLLALSNPMKVFVQNHIASSAGHYFTSADAWSHYVAVSQEAGLPVLESAAFYKQLAKSMGEIYQTATVNSLLGKQRGDRGFELV